MYGRLVSSQIIKKELLQTIETEIAEYFDALPTLFLPLTDHYCNTTEIYCHLMESDYIVLSDQNTLHRQKRQLLMFTATLARLLSTGMGMHNYFSKDNIYINLLYLIMITNISDFKIGANKAIHGSVTDFLVTPSLMKKDILSRDEFLHTIYHKDPGLFYSLSSSMMYHVDYINKVIYFIITIVLH